ncbi:hypothetical protein R1sor_009829 [Riccia sorocarpa]|uniref:AB hydrolase-1 domain-containing protein n=1 Tax=Riccia sorocarpa TaxID=122646 RepID=A0ABD3HWI6_9MARC
MGWFNFSLISMLQNSSIRSFERAGLESRMVQVGNEFNGSTVHVWVPKGYTTPPPEKPVVVLIHGFGASSVWQWEGQVKPLLRHFTVIATDLLFHGESTTQSPKRTESFQAETIVLCLRALGVTKFNVVGTSYGGFVAYRIAQNFPDTVEKLILSNSAVLMTPEDDRELCKRGGAETNWELLLPESEETVHRMLRLLFKKSSFFFLPRFVLRDYINVVHNPNRKEKRELLEALVIGKEAAPSLMTKVDKDVLIIWGDNDTIFLPFQAQRIKDYLGERAEMVMLEDAGHASQIEQAGKWNALVIEFFKRK